MFCFNETLNALIFQKLLWLDECNRIEDNGEEEANV